jgi:hypothetical protein
VQAAALSGFGRRLNSWDGTGFTGFILDNVWQVRSDGGYFKNRARARVAGEAGPNLQNNLEFTWYRSDNLKIGHIVFQEPIVASSYSILTARQCDRDRAVVSGARNDCLGVTFEDRFAIGNYRSGLIDDGDPNLRQRRGDLRLAARSQKNADRRCRRDYGFRKANHHCPDVVLLSSLR